MNKLDDELFNFITQPSNWTIAREIYERVEYAKTRLLKEFKQDVVEKIKTSMNLQEYKIDTPDPGRIQIKHTSWNNLFSIDYGNLHSKAYLGVWCDTQKEIILKSYEHISNAMKAADKKLTGKDAQWYPAWYYTGDNFSQL